MLPPCFWIPLPFLSRTVNDLPGQLLDIRDLNVLIKNKPRPLHPVRGVSFSVGASERVCLVGESGCGKSITAFSILRLLPRDKFMVPEGQIMFKGQDLLGLSSEEIRKIRGSRIGMVFQEPMTALNPVLSVGFQIAEAIYVHRKEPEVAVRKRVLNLMKDVGIPDPELTYLQYPHQLSGGLRQRAMIAMALSCGPDLLIADEPTTALDVTIQAQILDLLADLTSKMTLGLLLITHNLGVVARIAQKVLVMYAGKIVEESPVDMIFDEPLHPYTRGLLESVPYGEKVAARRLASIPGSVPPLTSIPSGCAFRDRCPSAKEICTRIQPELRTITGARKAACHLL